ncbi:MAG: hypothetical protein ACREQY_15650 [Candidatus Binatia bacterium]
MAATHTGKRQRARWARLGALGLLFVAAGVVLFLAAMLIFGLSSEGGEGAFFGIVIGVALLGAFLAWRFGWWGKVLGIVAAVLVGMALFWTPFGLQAFPSFFDFMPAVLVVPGAMLAVVSFIAALVAGRRGHNTPAATGNEVLGIRIALGVVGALAVITGAVTLFGRSSVEAVATDSFVVMSDFEFDRAGYTFAPGSRVVVRNDDPFWHTFTVDKLDIDVTVRPGSEILVDVPARSGDYVLYCRPHTEEPDDPEYGSDMAARLRIAPARPT